MALRPIYAAPTVEAAGAALDDFERGPWGKTFPTVVASWRRAWTHIIPFFAFPPDIRRLIYTNDFARERPWPIAQDHQNAQTVSQ